MFLREFESGAFLVSEWHGGTVGINGREPGIPYVLNVGTALYTDVLFSDAVNITIEKP